MITTHIRTTKKLFALALLALIFIIVFGSLSFKRNNIITRSAESFSRELQTITYGAEYRRFAGLAQAGIVGAEEPEGTLASQEARALPVLLYHGIVERPDRFSVSQETFKDQLFSLKRAGYRTVTLAQAQAFLSGDSPLPDKSFLLTFDDGRYDSFVNADPILKALGFQAVMFVATQSSLETTQNPHNRYYLDEADIARMIASGRWEIGSHAIQETGGIILLGEGTGEEVQGNFLSNKMWRDDLGRIENLDEYRTRIHREIADSKRILEETFAVPVIAFSYPFGDFGQQTENNDAAVEIVRQEVSSAYPMAFRQVWQSDTDETFNYPNQEDMRRLRRVEVETDWTGQQLVSFLATAQAKPIPYTDIFASDNGWKHAWGDVKVEGNNLILSAKETTAGAFAFLDGTKGWKNYRVGVKGEWQRGSHVSLIERYKDAENYAECLFSEDEIRIQQTVQGKVVVLKSQKTIEKLNKNKVSLAMSVDGSKISCRSGEKNVAVAYNLSQRLSDGGIGVKIWDQTLGISTLKLHSLEVTSVNTARVLN